MKVALTVLHPSLGCSRSGCWNGLTVPVMFDVIMLKELRDATTDGACYCCPGNTARHMNSLLISLCEFPWLVVLVLEVLEPSDGVYTSERG